VRLTDVQVRLLHSLITDHVFRLDLESCREVADYLSGVTTRALVESMADGRLRLRGLLDDHGRVLVAVELVDAVKVVPLFHVVPGLLGLDGEDVREECEQQWVDELTQIIDGF